MAGSVKNRLARRDFLRLGAFSAAGALLQPAPYIFNWRQDVPPSLMLHSGNVQFLPELLPALEREFTPMTYRDWITRLEKIEGFADWIARLFHVGREAVAQVLATQSLQKLPLILSIDDVGTDWIRVEHLALFQQLLDRGLPAVVGVQPKLMPEEEPRYWSKLQELNEAGWEIASHSINHPPLTQLNERTAKFEILESCRRIEEVIGTAPITLVPPFGDAASPEDTSPGNKQLYQLAQQAGIKVVAGIRGGRQRLPQPVRQDLDEIYGPAALPEYVGRIPPESDSAITLFNLQYFNGEGYSSV